MERVVFRILIVHLVTAAVYGPLKYVVSVAKIRTAHPDKTASRLSIKSYIDIIICTNVNETSINSKQYL